MISHFGGGVKSDTHKGPVGQKRPSSGELRSTNAQIEFLLRRALAEARRLPDHSSLTRIRQRYGLEVFRRFFDAIVDRCEAAGLVWGRELYLDATKMVANASVESVQPRFAVAARAHLDDLFAQDAEAQGPPPPVLSAARLGGPERAARSPPHLPQLCAYG